MTFSYSGHTYKVENLYKATRICHTFKQVLLSSIEMTLITPYQRTFTYKVIITHAVHKVNTIYSFNTTTKQ